MMRKLLVLLLTISCVLTITLSADEDSKAVRRVESAGTVLDEIQSAPDQGIPEEVLGSAECVAVIPTLLKGGFIFGGRYGKGVASCRTAKGWSAPAFFTIGGGSFGLQIGGEAVDLVMLIMNKEGMKNLLSSQFKLGADASAAAGPVGRHASADTDWKMKAQVLTYSRARGAFAGLELTRRRDQTGQRQHPRVLRAYGPVQDLARRQRRGTPDGISVLEQFGQMGQSGREQVRLGLWRHPFGQGLRAGSPAAPRARRPRDSR